RAAGGGPVRGPRPLASTPTAGAAPPRRLAPPPSPPPPPPLPRRSTTRVQPAATLSPENALRRGVLCSQRALQCDFVAELVEGGHGASCDLLSIVLAVEVSPEVSELRAIAQHVVDDYQDAVGDCDDGSIVVGLP